MDEIFLDFKGFINSSPNDMIEEGNTKIRKGCGEVTLKMYSYPPCGSCRKAKKWLNDHEVHFEEIHIVDNPPSRDELKALYERSEIELRKFFNTSGKRYRELGLKDVVKEASEDKLLDLLASDGMLIKRPIITDGTKVTVGFKEEQFEQVWRRNE